MSVTPPVDPNETLAQVAADGKTDASAIIDAARQAAKADAQTAADTAGKLLQMAAGDSSVLLAEAEIASVNKVISLVPEPFRAVVQTFAGQAVNGALSQANQIANAEVQKGLAHAEAGLTSLVAAFDKTIGA